MVRTYETTFIVNAGLDDPQIDAVIEKAKEVIVKNGGEVKDLAKWGRKRFAYTIKKKNNGFYAVIEFNAPGDTIAKLERHYQLDENIIRYLTIVLDKKALKARAAQVAKDLAMAESTSAPSPTPAAAPIPVAAKPVAAAVVVDDDEDDDEDEA
ncbi:MAG: 30S ribosomal protein S6 [Ignavibacteriae bacterium]|nr:30S ribosomal protein S6 [Ignavibacteriota bacterium]